MIWGAALGVMSACGGSDRQYVGAGPVVFDETGAVAGVDSSALTFVTDDAGGFAYGLAADVDANVIGNVGLSPSGDTGSYAVSGLLPDHDVGPAFTSGVATFTGRYEMAVFTGHEDTPNADAWAREDFAGGVSVTIDLHQEGSHLDDPDHGHVHLEDEIQLTVSSNDGRLVFDDVPLFALQRPALPPTTSPLDAEGGTATLDGLKVSLSSQVIAGQEGVVAAFQGEGPNTLVAGGLVAQ